MLRSKSARPTKKSKKTKEAQILGKRKCHKQLGTNSKAKCPRIEDNVASEEGSLKMNANPKPKEKTSSESASPSSMSNIEDHSNEEASLNLTKKS